MRYWYWVHVYNYDRIIGSFYTTESTKEAISKEINEQYGVGNWTKFVKE